MRRYHYITDLDLSIRPDRIVATINVTVELRRIGGKWSVWEVGAECLDGEQISISSNGIVMMQNGKFDFPMLGQLIFKTAVDDFERRRAVIENDIEAEIIAA